VTVARSNESFTNPWLFLNRILERVSARKLRLFILACCRHPDVWNKLLPLGQRMVEAAEAMAGGKPLSSATFAQTWMYPQLLAEDLDIAFEVRSCIGYEIREPVAPLGTYAGRRGDWALICLPHPCPDTYKTTILHDLFDDHFLLPFTRPSSPEDWDRHLELLEVRYRNRSLVRRLAEPIYEEHAFERLPILADALEEAGCTNPDILDHCRASSLHHHGCWVLDLLLGKE
jgi:hypothetical protein